MRRLCLGLAVAIGSCTLVGCDAGSPAPSDATATPENPKAGLDALNKLKEGPRPTAKGLVAPGDEKKK